MATSETLLRQFDNRLTKHEARFEREMRSLFIEQRTDLIQTLNALDEDDPAVVDELFSPSDYRDAWEPIVRRWMEASIIDEAEDTASTFGLTADEEESELVEAGRSSIQRRRGWLRA